MFEHCSSDRFSKEVCYLVSSINIYKGYNILRYQITEIMIFNFNVFITFVVYRIFRHGNADIIVFIDVGSRSELDGALR